MGRAGGWVRGGGGDPARVQLWEAGMRVWQDTEWQGRGDGEFHLGGKRRALALQLS